MYNQVLETADLIFMEEGRWTRIVNFAKNAAYGQYYDEICQVCRIEEWMEDFQKAGLSSFVSIYDLTYVLSSNRI